VTTALSDCIAHHTHLENLASFCARREGPIRLGAAKVMGAADRARADQVRVMHMTHERPRWRDCYCGQEQLVGYVASNSDR